MVRVGRKKYDRSNSQAAAGQGLVEYALILVLVAIVVIAVLMLVGPTIAKEFPLIKCSLSDEDPCPSGFGKPIQDDISLYSTGPGAIDSSEALRLVSAFEEEVVHQETSILTAVNILGEATGPIIDVLLQDAIDRGDDDLVQVYLEAKEEFEALYPGSP